jgi:hypothetical protein
MKQFYNCFPYQNISHTVLRKHFPLLEGMESCFQNWKAAIQLSAVAIWQCATFKTLVECFQLFKALANVKWILFMDLQIRKMQTIAIFYNLANPCLLGHWPDHCWSTLILRWTCTCNFKGLTSQNTPPSQCLLPAWNCLFKAYCTPWYMRAPEDLCGQTRI